LGQELLDTIRIYNLIPEEAVADAQAALEREYAVFCQRRSQP